MQKTDFKKELGVYRAPRGRFEIVEVPELQYLMIDGHGDPNTGADFAGATEALYPLAYRLKFASKQRLGRDYTVMPLEGLWWADDLTTFTSRRDKSRWDWTLLIMTPEWIDQAMLAEAVEQVTAKGAPRRLPEVRLAGLAEGRCVQTLYVGAYDDEAEVLARLHDEFVPAHGLTPTGKHHEIYLSDPRRTAPEKRRTILRQPVTAGCGQPGTRRALRS